MDLVDKLVAGFVALCLTVIGFFLKGRDQKLKEVIDQVNLLALQKVGKTEFDTHRAESEHRFEIMQEKLRCDVISLHSKIENGNRDINIKIDQNQRDTNGRLDKIFEAVNK